jgi:hypothetical protein
MHGSKSWWLSRLWTMRFSKKRYREITEPGREAQGSQTRKTTDERFRASGM